jgi:hypothetical protein
VAGRHPAPAPTPIAASGPLDVNDCGEIVGVTIDAAGSWHGFRLAHARYQTFAPPFGQRFLFPPALNNRGQIVGAALTLGDDPNRYGHRAADMMGCSQWLPGRFRLRAAAGIGYRAAGLRLSPGGPAGTVARGRRCWGGR